jgi:hypothetical protein
MNTYVNGSGVYYVPGHLIPELSAFINTVKSHHFCAVRAIFLL